MQTTGTFDLDVLLPHCQLFNISYSVFCMLNENGICCNCTDGEEAVIKSDGKGKSTLVRRILPQEQRVANVLSECDVCCYPSRM